MAAGPRSGCRVCPGLGGLGLVGPAHPHSGGLSARRWLDAIARLLADKLKDELGGVTVLVENRPGAGGQIAAQLLKACLPMAIRCFSRMTTPSPSCPRS
jgi:hypothetical protein